MQAWITPPSRALGPATWACICSSSSAAVILTCHYGARPGLRRLMGGAAHTPPGGWAPLTAATAWLLGEAAASRCRCGIGLINLTMLAHWFDAS